jgi:hypothetical protein
MTAQCGQNTTSFPRTRLPHARLAVMASEVAVAVISGGTGVVGLAIGSVVTRWANWGFEKSRRKEDRRVARIESWRVEIRQLRNAENSCVARNEERRAKQEPELGDLPEADPMHHEWFRDLQLELAEDAVERVEELRQKPVKDRLGEVPNLLEEEVRRIERSEWKLV